MILDVKFHVGFHDQIETFLLHKNAIDSGLKTRNDVNTTFVCLCGGRNVGEDVHSLYLDFGYWKPVGIGDAAAEFGVGGLSKGGSSAENHPQGRDGQKRCFGADSHSRPPHNLLTPVNTSLSRVCRRASPFVPPCLLGRDKQLQVLRITTSLAMPRNERLSRKTEAR